MKLVEAAEQIANNRKLPARLVDWADARYNELTNGAAMIRVSHLTALSLYCENPEQGLHQIGLLLDRGEHNTHAALVEAARAALDELERLSRETEAHRIGYPDIERMNALRAALAAEEDV
jgi:hypothetical protein